MQQQVRVQISDWEVCKIATLALVFELEAVEADVVGF